MTRTPRRMLVADSDSEFARRLRAELEARGYAVEVAGDGVSALKMVKTRAFDGAIIDADLVALDGLHVLSGAAEAGRSLPVVVMGQRGRADLDRRAKDLGARAYIGKPCSPAEVVDALLHSAPSETYPVPRVPQLVTLASLEPGQVLLIECPAGQVEGRLSSRLLAKQPASLAAAMPQREGRAITLPFGTRVMIGFPMPDGWYQFETSVLGATMYAGEPALLLAQPKVLSHIQRRQFARSRGRFDVNVKGEGGVVPGMGQDAGEGGMRVLTDGALAVGARVTCLVAAPESPHRLAVSGTVIWTQELRDNGERYRTGIQFAGLSPAERQRLRTWVQHLGGDQEAEVSGRESDFGTPIMS
jgi:CheY-like chemotaxis protein